MPAGSLGQGFGDKGQMVISADAYTYFSKTNTQGWGFEFRPALDYFIAPSITVGGLVGIGLASGDAKGFAIGPRAGFNFNFTENIGVWARVGVVVDYVSQPGGSSTVTHGDLFVPINYHIVPHVFVGIGPYYNLKLSGDYLNNYGFTSIVGAWW
jgi:hypothetical protein